jgi:hypothetical protein
VPLHHGGWLNQHHHIEAARPQPIQPDPEQAVEREEPRAAGTLAPQDRQLAAERKDLKLRFRTAAKPAAEP